MLPDQEQFHVALCALPLREKLAHLVFALLLDDPVASAENLIEITTIMCRHLPSGQRMEVRWLLADALSELEGRLN